MLKSLIAAVLGAMLVMAPPPARAQILIENVTVLPFTGPGPGKIAGVDVYVMGDRIVQVGANLSARAAPETVRINGHGKFLIPGITEMHGHIPHPTEDPQYLDDSLFLFVSHGVTTVRGMLGFPGHLKLKNRIAVGKLKGPTLYLASPGFGYNVSSPEGAAARVKRYADEGWDLIKIFDGLTPAEFDAIAKQAALSKIDFAGHMPRSLEMDHFLASGVRTIEHMDGYIEALKGENRRLPDDLLRGAARRTKAGKVGVVPTMAVWDILLKLPNPEDLKRYPELKYLPPERAKQWWNLQGSVLARLKNTVKSLIYRTNAEVISENRCRLLNLMDEEGVEILFGSDAPQRYSMPGFSILREMRAMARCGMSNARILETATAAPGAYFSNRDKFGIIAAGARADMILLKANPVDNLETLAEPEGVVLRGRWLGSREIKKTLKRIEERNARSR